MMYACSCVGGANALKVIVGLLHLDVQQNKMAKEHSHILLCLWKRNAKQLTMEQSRTVVPNYGSLYVFELKLSEAFTTSCAGQDFCSPRVTVDPRLGTTSVEPLFLTY